jgi:hypothetical protein
MTTVRLVELVYSATVFIPWLRAASLSSREGEASYATQSHTKNLAIYPVHTRAMAHALAHCLREA